LTQIGLYGEEHPQGDVRGLLIGLQASHFPRWPSRVGGPEAIATAVCLAQFLPQWFEREPDGSSPLRFDLSCWIPWRNTDFPPKYVGM
jgi:hypothetical protein